VEAVLPHVPVARTNDVALFRPADLSHPISFNVFRQGRRIYTDAGLDDANQSAGSTELLSSQLISVFKKAWSAFWGPRLEHVLRNAILAVAPDPRATLLFLYRFLTDETLREKTTARLKDPVVREFWGVEWPRYGARLQAEALSPVLNKLGAFLSSPLIRNIVGQVRSRLDLLALMDGRQVILADLAVGALGEDVSHLLGGLILSSLHLAALGRRPGAPAFFVYADEFQHFVNDSIATMLSESRKFGLGLILAHQYLSQLPESLRSAVLGNSGSLVAFRLGAEDAALLEGELNPPFTAADLRELGPHQVAVRVVAQGAQLRPFSARTPPPQAPPVDAEAVVRNIVAQSRLRYSVPRERVEREVEVLMQG
jgi:hypothetical protein